MTLRKIGILMAAVAAVALSVSAPAQAATPKPLSTQDNGVLPDSGAVFTPLPPTRIFDSRDSTKISAYTSRHVDIPEELVPDDATALVFNLTGTDPDGATFLATGPGLSGSPSTSSVNLAAGETRANLVTVAMDQGAARGIWLGAGPAAADAIVDLAGFYAPGDGAKYTPLTPQRMLDTRNSSPVGAGGTVTLDLSSKVPAGATAAVFNLTATDVTGPTFVTAYPADQGRPDASNLNLVAGKNTPNLVTVQLSPDRKVTLANSYWSVDLIADLAGYYSPGGTQAFYSVYPIRVLETRDVYGNPRHPILSGQTRPLDLSGWLPAGATAAVTNLTGTDVTQSTVVTAWADGAPQPGVSNLNLVPGQTSANLAIVPVGADRALDLNNLTGQLDMVVDLAGYFAPAIPACAANCAYSITWNSQGEIGNGTTDGMQHGPSLTYGLSDVTSIVGGLGTGNGYALRSDGTVWAWGQNDLGQLGIGTYGLAEGPTERPYSYGPPAFYSTLPVQVPGLSNVVAIDAEMALTADGHVYTWGDNYTWKLGTGATDTEAVAASPVQVPGLTDVKAIAQDRDYMGGVTRYALKSNGTVWSWGSNLQGALGAGTGGTTADCYPAAAPIPSGPNCASAVPVQVVGLFGCNGLAPRIVLCGDGSVWRWGALNRSSEQDTPAALPLPASAVTRVQRDSDPEKGARGILADGTVWQWNDEDGYNGDMTGAQVPGLSSIKALAEAVAGDDIALDTGGTVRKILSPSTVVITGATTIGNNGYGVVGTP